MKRQITYQKTFKGLEINTDPEREQGCYLDILETLFTQLCHATNRYSRICFIRFDVHFPRNYYSVNPEGDFRRFIADLIRALKVKGLAPRYLWREALGEKADLPHLHVVLLLKGHDIKSPYPFFKEAEKRWARHLGLCTAKGLIDWCPPRNPNHLPNGIRLDKSLNNFPYLFGRVFKWGSYLAKTREDELNPNCRSFGYSQFDPEESEDIQPPHEAFRC